MNHNKNILLLLIHNLRLWVRSETIRSVMAGYGANFISSLAVREYVDSGQLARVYVKDIHIKHKIAICTRKNERHSILVQKFIETVKSSL